MSILRSMNEKKNYSEKSINEKIKEKSLITKAFSSIGVDKPFDTEMVEASFECGFDLRGKFAWQNGNTYYLSMEVRTFDFLGGNISLSELDSEGKFTDAEDMEFENLKNVRKFLMSNKK